MSRAILVRKDKATIVKQHELIGLPLITYILPVSLHQDKIYLILLS